MEYCGYLSFGGETGHPHKPVAVKTASRDGIPELLKLRRNLRERSAGVIKEALRSVLAVIDPDVSKEGRLLLGNSS